jgi:hypothetical protein
MFVSEADVFKEATQHAHRASIDLNRLSIDVICPILYRPATREVNDATSTSWSSCGGPRWMP